MCAVTASRVSRRRPLEGSLDTPSLLLVSIRERKPMPNDLDANLKLLYATDVNTFSSIDDVKLDDPFDVVLDVEIGRDLNQSVDRHDTRVAIRNLTRSVVAATVDGSEPLVPANNSDFQTQWRINIPAGWGLNAQAGDVLQAVASYRVTAGANFDFSTAESRPFVVS
jgi:hypothetical protein